MWSKFLQVNYSCTNLVKVQHDAHKLRDDIVHEMCNVLGYGFSNFRPIINQCIVKFKVYQVLCYEFLFMIQIYY
jgi:hypothetical protein